MLYSTYSCGWILSILPQMITSMRGCVTWNSLRPWPISSRTFNHDFAIKRLKYDTSCCVHCTACTVLDRFFPYLAQTSTGIDADASKGETSPGYFNSKLVNSYKCGTIFLWEFPEVFLAYSHIFLKGPSRSIIYGQIFWPPHPHPHIASPASIYHQNKLSFFSVFLSFNYSFWECRQYL